MGRTTGAVGAAVLLLAGWTVVRAQSQAPPIPGRPDIMPALLEEVRGLRTALEQMTSAGPRVQLALGRLQLQEQRLNAAVKRLDEVRSKLAEIQRSQSEAQQQLATLDTAMKATHFAAAVSAGNDVPTQEQVEEIRTHHRRHLAHLNGELQRLTAEESIYATDVTTEQARWTDFNQRLEDLERRLRPLK
jgi:chromosome segregation ATPase